MKSNNPQWHGVIPDTWILKKNHKYIYICEYANRWNKEVRTQRVSWREQKLIIFSPATSAAPHIQLKTASSFSVNHKASGDILQNKTWDVSPFSNSFVCLISDLKSIILFYFLFIWSSLRNDRHKRACKNLNNAI